MNRAQNDITLEDMKGTIFDPVLARIIAVRVIYHYQITEYFRYRPLMDRLIPLITRVVNPELLDVIRNRTLVRAANGSDIYQKNYVPEDQLRSCVRKLVEFEHGRNDKIMLRAMTESCINLVTSIVNSKDFSAEMRVLKRDENIIRLRE